MTELVPIAYDLIPFRRKKLLLFSTYPLNEIQAMSTLHPVITIGGPKHETIPNDPSIIFLSLRVICPNNPAKIPSPSMPVSYAILDPCQRYVYLSWLRDVSKPVPDEYVLLYYLGLERHLLYGDFEGAFNEILFLRKHHSAPRMRSNSFLALLWACEKRGRIDLVSSLLPHYEDHYYGINALVSLMYFFGLSFSPEMLFSVRPRFCAEVNTRYIHAHPDLYMDSLESALMKRYGRPELPVRDIVDISNVETIKERAFANPSIPYTDSFVIYYDFRHDQRFNEVLKDIFQDAHERTKQFLRKKRQTLIKSSQMNRGKPTSITMIVGS